MILPSAAEACLFYFLEKSKEMEWVVILVNIYPQLWTIPIMPG
jgi:hypothetical protein